MNMEALKNDVSLTKGCFVHKPTGTKRKCSSKGQKEVCKNPQYKNLWQQMEAEIRKIESHAYKKTFEAIVNFVSHCYKFPLEDVNEIPTSVLVMGVNMPDHSHIFQLLEKELHLHGIFGTVILQSKNNSNFFQMMQKVISQLFHKYQEEVDDRLSKLDCTFSKLCSYYESLPDEKVRSPRKRSKSTNKKDKPLVILVQDVEAFNANFLQELVLNCNLYRGRLPVVLVFGMSSAMVTLHNILPQKALCCLGIETFYSLTATEYLTKIIEQVVISPFQPFKLGPKVYKLLIDTVLYHDFSISNLTGMLKYCMMEHFYNKPISVLCCEEFELEDKVSKLSLEELQSFKTIPSFENYMENNPHFSAKLNNTSEFKAMIMDHVLKLYSHQKLNLILLQCLHCLSCDLPTYPLGKQLREVYSLALEKEIVHSNAYKEAEKFLRMLSQNDLIERLSKCLCILKASSLDSIILRDGIDTLGKFSAELSQMKTNEMEKVPVSVENEKIMSRSQLQEKIRQTLQLKRSKFDQFKMELLNSLLILFKHITPPSKWSLHEVFYFNDAVSVKKHWMASPRIEAQRSLADPHHYLKCSCCQVESLCASMPDISVLYKLHLESGKLINLYDWLESFKSIKEEGPKKRRKATPNDSQLNIRFMQAVSELQLLGFVKPTKRKTDHVARLTFGS